MRGEKRRRLHKAFLRYHDPANWPLLRDALMAMGRADLIGNGKQHLIPSFQPAGTGGAVRAKWPEPTESSKAAKTAAPRRGTLLTQHTGLPPRSTGAAAKPGATKLVAGQRKPAAAGRPPVRGKRG